MIPLDSFNFEKMLQMKGHIVDWINIVSQWPFLNVTNQPNWNNDSGNVYISKYYPIPYKSISNDSQFKFDYFLSLFQVYLKVLSLYLFSSCV